ncbi:2-amino-4-hydroxy-6-hydroxymethyldihydropteridine pyrophosphokinase [Opitutaceae bacterium TAV5]|nr:2-amino-4-hydroxy-6-hydroxymethyldihydropteridine pyrophosphokinase [Opitutaceae bacterium TAV5]
MPTSTAYLSLGSNLGDRRGWLEEALRLLSLSSGIRLGRVSRIYETTPVGTTGQGDYLNAVAAVETSLAPHALLARCQEIEDACGRVRQERWSARTLDIDLLWHEACPRSDDPVLTLPHPRMLERAFVMVLLAELAPDRVIEGRTVREHAARLGSEGVRVWEG